jgi:hypothetical protein
MNRKFIIEYCLAKNMFIILNMDYSLAEVTFQGVIIYRMFEIKYFLAKNIFSRSKMDYCLDDLHQKESMRIYSKLPFGYPLARIFFNGSNIGWLT